MSEKTRGPESEKTRDPDMNGKGGERKRKRRRERETCKDKMGKQQMPRKERGNNVGNEVQIRGGGGINNNGEKKSIT